MFTHIYTHICKHVSEYVFLHIKRNLEAETANWYSFLSRFTTKNYEFTILYIIQIVTLSINILLLFSKALRVWIASGTLFRVKLSAFIQQDLVTSNLKTH